MLEKMKSNANVIVAILSVIAGALLLPTVFGYFGSKLSDYSIVYLIHFGLILAADIIIAAFAYKKKAFNKMLALPLMMVYGSYILTDVYGLINNGDYTWTNIPYLVLYAAIIIIYVVSLTNKKVMPVIYVLLLINFAFSIASIFAGSVIGLSLAVTEVVICYIIYSENKTEEKENE